MCDVSKNQVWSRGVGACLCEVREFLSMVYKVKTHSRDELLTTELPDESEDRRPFQGVSCENYYPTFVKPHV